MNVTIYAYIIMLQVLFKNNLALLCWIAITLRDCIMFRYKLPLTVWFHHISGLLTATSMLFMKDRKRFLFVWLESGFIGTLLVKEDGYSTRSLLFNLLLHICIRWPVLYTGITAMNKKGLKIIAGLGCAQYLLDIYWIGRIYQRKRQIKDEDEPEII